MKISWSRSRNMVMKSQSSCSGCYSAVPLISLTSVSGVQYYTGQLFNIKEITRLGHEKVRSQYTYIHSLIYLIDRDVLLDSIWLMRLAMWSWSYTSGMLILQRGVVTNIWIRVLVVSLVYLSTSGILVPRCPGISGRVKCIYTCSYLYSAI
jgi:hypothetical protein